MTFANLYAMILTKKDYKCNKAQSFYGSYKKKELMLRVKPITIFEIWAVSRY